MAENTYLENGRTENDDTEKDQKYRHWKMAESTHLENDRTENDNTEKDQKYRHWKMAENTHLESVCSGCTISSLPCVDLLTLWTFCLLANVDSANLCCLNDFRLTELLASTV